MKIIVHGGNDQIGGNCIEIASETTRLIFDIGMPLDGLQFQCDELASIEKRESLLREGILPDVQGLYYWDEPIVDAVVISHSHMDHVGRCTMYQIPVIYLHTSGHADADTLQQLINCLKPRKIIPVHTLHGEDFLNFAPEVIKTQKSKPIVI